MFLEISQNLQENTSARVYFLIKSQVEACNFTKKETLARVFYCRFCKISKSTIFYRIPPVATVVLWNFFAKFEQIGANWFQNFKSVSYDLIENLHTDYFEGT